MLETKPWCNSRHGAEIVGLFRVFLGSGFKGFRDKGLGLSGGLGFGLWDFDLSGV